MPIEPTTVPRRWAHLKSLIIVCGSLLAAVYTVANVLALYYAKAYLIDRPALTVNMQVEQIGPTEAQRYLLVTLAFENNGVRPYDLTLKGLKPITIASVTVGLDGEPSYRLLKQISLPSVYPEGQSVVIHDINGIIFSPGERGKNAVATAVPEPGLYFVEFNAAVAYRSLIGEFLWNRIVNATPEPSWLSANAYVYIK
ncbi:MAG TPA: hypothetical protein VN523_01690 [Hyphomicrobiaceae bacterium]|nr:hypothetical protein [Hyphomicrobiaceae bacterium]